jgi:hypothetical protein
MAMQLVVHGWIAWLLHIVQRFLKLMYSVDILNNVSQYICSSPSTHGISGLDAGGVSEQYVARLTMTIELTQGYTLERLSSEYGD